MMNPAATSQSKPELYTFGRYLKQTFGYPVQKISIDAGFTCPNRDGTKAVGRCTYCNNRSFSLGMANRRLPVREQVLTEIERVRHCSRKKAEHFLAYFQSFSNTYAPVEQLRQIYAVHGRYTGRHLDCAALASLKAGN